MARGFPSMTALLGLLAVAGYQNRDKIAEMLRGANPASTANPANTVAGDSGLGGILGSLGGSRGAGGLLSGGLGELLDRFKQNGQGELANSWVRQGTNQPITPEQLRVSLGADVITTLVQQTGLSEQEVLSRLSSQLPEAVDKYTPDGRLPVGVKRSFGPAG